jgi:hypothetical protein
MLAAKKPKASASMTMSSMGWMLLYVVSSSETE